MKNYNQKRWECALNNACLIISKSEYTSIELNLKRTEIIELANFIYKLEPKLGNNGDEIIPDGQREDQAELRSEDLPF